MIRNSKFEIRSSKLTALWLTVLLFVQAILPQISQAAFDDFGVGGRAPGMADAYTAISDNADAVYYNPAGLPQLREAQLSTQYGQLLSGANDGSSNSNTYLSFAQPLQNKNLGSIGVGYQMFNFSDLLSERTLLLSYGHELKEPLFDWDGLWSFGFNAKQLYRQFKPNTYTQNAVNGVQTGTGQTDPLFARNGYDKTAYALDAGAMVRFGPSNRHSVGLSVMNLNQPDVSLAGDGDKPPLITKLGFATRPRWGLMSVELRRAQRLASQTDTDIAIGAERRFNLSAEGQRFTIRGGYAQGSRNYRSFTTGISYDFGRVTLDYAFGFPLGALSQASGTHRFGLTFKFLPPTAKEKNEETVPPLPIKTNMQTLPEAPTTLVAPQPMSVTETKKLTEFEADAKNFGELLGVYFNRKSQGALPEERILLLKQIKSRYTNRGLDMSLVDKELKELETIPGPVTPRVIPTPTVTPPVVKVAPKLPLAKPKVSKAPKPVLKPKPVKKPRPKNIAAMSSLSQMAANSPELEQALRYYHLAVERDISDFERIEVLEMIVQKFGEPATKKISGELERLRQRTR